MLPTDTDFYGITDQPYRGTRLSEEPRDTLLLPFALTDGVPTVDITTQATGPDE